MKITVKIHAKEFENLKQELTALQFLVCPKKPLKMIIKTSPYHPFMLIQIYVKKLKDFHNEYRPHIKDQEATTPEKILRHYGITGISSFMTLDSGDFMKYFHPEILGEHINPNRRKKIILEYDPAFPHSIIYALEDT